jgi:hypothetical protein
VSTYIDSMHWDEVWMPASNEKAMLDAIAKKVRKSQSNPFPNNFDRYDTLEKLLEGGPLHGIGIERRGDRVVFGGDNDREKLSDLDDVLRRMAPHMGGGEVRMRAEDADWKWVFKDGQVLSVGGRVVYYDELPDGYCNRPMWNGWFLYGQPAPDEVWFEVER